MLWVVTIAVLVAAVPFYVSIAAHVAQPTSGTPPVLAEAYAHSALDHVSNSFVWLSLAAFATIGAVVTTRQPDNRMGWLFSAIGGLFAAEWLTAVYAVESFVVREAPLPGAIGAAWLNSWLWIPAFGFIIAILPLTYPDGRVASRRWRAVSMIAAAAMTTAVFSVAFHTGTLINYVEPLDIPNPLSVPWLEAENLLTLIAFVVLLATMVAAVVSLLDRLRRARGRRRDQLRWFAYAGAVLVAAFIAQFVVRHVLGIDSAVFEVPLTVFWGLAFLGLPIATGLAILRHRLFDIERLVNRTLVYGFLSVVLIVVYVVGVLGVGAVIAAFGGGRNSDLAVAASTLAVAAAFGPARRRLQHSVDRRFYRARYDAALAVEQLAGRLRSEVDPQTVRDDIIASARAALHPSSLGLWIRPAAADPPSRASSF
jgi:hypothetical protein